MSRRCVLILSALSLLLTSFNCLAADKLGVAIPYTPGAIDPLKLNEPVNRIILSNVSYGLSRLAEDGQCELEAAQSMSAEQGNAKWSIELEPEVRFPSQKLVLAGDLQASLEFLKKLSKNHKQGSFLINKLGNISSISIYDKKNSYRSGEHQRLLIFDLIKPDPSFPLFLSVFPLVDTIVAKSFGPDFSIGTNVAFVGPFQVRENRSDRGVLLEKVQEFYRLGLPKAFLIDFHYFSEAGEALKALRVGAVDIIAMPTPSQLEDIKDDPTLASLPSPLLNLAKITGPWDLAKTHWSNVNSELDVLVTDRVIVRKALRVDKAFLARFDLSGTFLP